MIKVCLIDNYDSFTYNVYHYLSEFNCRVTVLRNDKFKIKDLKNFDKIVISPGPGNPDQAGMCLEVVDKYIGEKSKPAIEANYVLRSMDKFPNRTYKFDNRNYLMEYMNFKWAKINDGVLTFH